MTLKQQPYHVLDAEGKEVFTGTHQECLRYEIEQDNIELITLPVNDNESPTVYELNDNELNYNYED